MLQFVADMLKSYLTLILTFWPGDLKSPKYYQKKKNSGEITQKRGITLVSSFICYKSFFCLPDLDIDTMTLKLPFIIKIVIGARIIHWSYMYVILYRRLNSRRFISIWTISLWISYCMPYYVSIIIMYIYLKPFVHSTHKWFNLIILLYKWIY